uniref:Reverse transcriptase domain-containing protein n=1 Tax=Trichuris muris TaxID=70415 RepID=A0A5S6QML8_TRIMR
MGSPLSPTIAEIFMEDLEKKAFPAGLLAHQVKMFKRYVDDIFVIVKKGKEEGLLQHLNSLFPNIITFTIEKEKNGELPFLDVLVIKKRASEGDKPRNYSASEQSCVLHSKVSRTHISEILADLNFYQLSPMETFGLVVIFFGFCCPNISAKRSTSVLVSGFPELARSVGWLSDCTVWPSTSREQTGAVTLLRAGWLSDCSKEIITPYWSSGPADIGRADCGQLLR